MVKRVLEEEVAKAREANRKAGEEALAASRAAIEAWKRQQEAEKAAGLFSNRTGPVLPSGAYTVCQL